MSIDGGDRLGIALAPGHLVAQRFEDELAERFGVPHPGDDEHARMAPYRLVLPDPAQRERAEPGMVLAALAEPGRTRRVRARARERNGS